MIRGVHAMFYSSEADELRAFLRDKISLPAHDVGEGWLIFDAPEVEIGCHPSTAKAPSGKHDVSFYCDDLEATVAKLTARGVEFLAPIADHGYALVTYFTAPGGLTLQLYQPKYVKA